MSAHDDDTAGTPEHNLRADAVVEIESITGLLDSSGGDWDEDGFHLMLTTDEGDTAHLRVNDVETARELIAAIGQLSAWVDEHDRERASYDAASPAERAAVLGQAVEDPAELLRHAADIQRKYERENP